MPHAHMWVMPQKARTLTTSSAGGCRAGHARPTKSASCKGRGMLPSTAGFQLVENTRNDFRPTPCWCTTTFCHIQMVQQLANSDWSSKTIYFQQQMRNVAMCLNPTNTQTAWWWPAYRRIKRRQDAGYHKLFAQSSWYLLWLPRFGLPKPNPPS